MKHLITLYFDCEPMAKQSDRSMIMKTKMSGKSFIHHYQNSEIRKRENYYKIMTKQQLPEGFQIIDGALAVGLEYSFHPPRTLRKAEKSHIENGGKILKTTKPDITDNLNKLLFDALEGIIYTNDSRICELIRCQKFYSKKPYVRVTFYQLENTMIT